jgi:hypothetical protein
MNVVNQMKQCEPNERRESNEQREQNEQNSFYDHKLQHVPLLWYDLANSFLGGGTNDDFHL